MASTLPHECPNRRTFLLTKTREQEFDKRNGILHELFNAPGLSAVTGFFIISVLVSLLRPAILRSG
jgi:hypothetical protein